jgi:hypothetical protein
LQFCLSNNTVHAREVLQQRRQSRRQIAYGGERRSKIASALSSKASATREGEGLPACGKKEEETTRTGEGGDGIFPEKKHWRSLIRRRCHLIHGRGAPTVRGKRRGHHLPAAEPPRAAVSMADGRGHEAVA